MLSQEKWLSIIERKTVLQLVNRQKRQDNIQVSNLQDKSICTHPITHPINASGQTPKSSHQYPLTPFSAKNDSQQHHCQQRITAASIECQMKEPEKEHTIYESKAATQICKAIGAQRSLAEFDKIRVERNYFKVNT